MAEMTLVPHKSPLNSLKSGGVPVTREIGDVFGFKVVK